MPLAPRQRLKLGKTKETAMDEATKVVPTKLKGKGKDTSFLKSKRKTSGSSVEGAPRKNTGIGHAGYRKSDGTVPLQFICLEQPVWETSCALNHELTSFVDLFGRLVRCLPRDRWNR